MSVGRQATGSMGIKEKHLVAKFEIVKIGNPVLRKKASVIARDILKDRSFKKLLKEMVSTMHRMQGVGLAANQVGLGIQLIVLECEANPRYPQAKGFPLEIWINPRIVEYSKEKEEGWEGCLSIPGYRGVVPRSKRVTFEAITPEGKKAYKTVEGFHARVIQHEVDHINGYFYIDRMMDFRSWMHLDEFNQRLQTHVKNR